MRQGTDDERDAVLSYVESQGTADRVVHVEKVATEAVGSVVHDIWDVHCSASRWWVVSNPMNLYSQDDFKSRDVVLTFHVGLMLRVATQHNVPITDEAATLLPEAWRLLGAGHRHAVYRPRGRGLPSGRRPTPGVDGVVRR